VKSLHITGVDQERALKDGQLHQIVAYRFASPGQPGATRQALAAPLPASLDHMILASPDR